MTIRSVMMTVLAVFFRSGVPVLEGGVTMRWLTSFKAGLVLMGVCCVTWSVLGTHSAAVADAEAARQFGGLCPKYKAGACGKAGTGGVHLPCCSGSYCSALSGFLSGAQDGTEGKGTHYQACGGTCGTITTAFDAGCGG